MLQQLLLLWLKSWRSIFEIILLSVVIYYGYVYFRGTRGAKVLTGLAIVFLTLTLISTLLNLVVIGWIVRSFSVFLAVALVVIFNRSCAAVWPSWADIRFFPSRAKSVRRCTTWPRPSRNWRTNNSARSSPSNAIPPSVFMKRPA